MIKESIYFYAGKPKVPDSNYLMRVNDMDEKEMDSRTC
jgi:hypothetical protein